MLSTSARRGRAALPVLCAALALALVAGGCGSGSSSSASASPSGGSAGGSSATNASASTGKACTKDGLSLIHPGQLTVATDKPAFPPYFADGKPESGKGFESAVAYAIAQQLGFTRGEVQWVVEPFDSSYAPGPKSFDFDVNQISITRQRSQHVDFSAPYYTAPQAVVALKSSAAANATSLSALAGAQLGVQIGTTSLDAANASIKPSKQPKVFNDSTDVVRALKQGQVDAVVVDLPTAFYLTAAQVPQAKIVGQFNAPGGDSFGALLAKGSKLTACVTQALGKLRSSGQLAQITQRWMGGAAGAPALQ
jgi:polar amino acid transport system substrate-binding protein